MRCIQGGVACLLGECLSSCSQSQRRQGFALSVPAARSRNSLHLVWKATSSVSGALLRSFLSGKIRSRTCCLRIVSGGSSSAEGIGRHHGSSGGISALASSSTSGFTSNDWPRNGEPRLRVPGVRVFPSFANPVDTFCTPYPESIHYFRLVT